MKSIGSCSYDEKLKILHKFVHEQSICESDLDVILQEVLFVGWGTRVVNYTRGPAAIKLLEENEAMQFLYRR